MKATELHKQLAVVSGFFAVFLVFICAFGLSRQGSTSNLIPKPGSIIDMRGDRIMLLRNVAREPYFGLGIHSDRYAVLFPYPESRGNIVKLTNEEWAEVIKFREDWCLNASESELEVVNERELEIGVRCNDISYSVTQKMIERDEIPPIFNRIINRISLSGE